jgi:hypothetical protein
LVIKNFSFPKLSLATLLYKFAKRYFEWSKKNGCDPDKVRQEIGQILQEKSSAPWGGIVGERFVNVREINRELLKGRLALQVQCPSGAKGLLIKMIYG